MATVFPSDAQRQQLTSVERHLPSPGVRNSSEGPCFVGGLAWSGPRHNVRCQASYALSVLFKTGACAMEGGRMGGAR